jgi:hypothetical protein
MATPGQLVEALHLVTGIPLPTIVDLDRKLVIGGLRTKGGRGLHAAQMTPLDAARLMTALLGSSHANAAVDAVRRYAATRCENDRSSDEQFGPSKIDELTSLAANHSFVDAMTALIGAISTGSLAKLIDDDAEGTGPHIEIFALTRATRGRIRISGLPDGLTASMEYIPCPAAAKRTTRRGMAIEQGSGDLEQSRRITEQTIFRVAKILA